MTSIFHPTDFSPESEIAFAHALKLAVATNSALRIMHVEPQASDVDWQSFPSVRATLARWGVQTSKSTGEDGGLHINKILTYREDPAASILQQLRDNPADLIVLATHQHDALDRLLGKTVAEPIARQSHARALFIPAGISGFVELETGAVRLQQIVIPVDHHPSPQSAVDAAAALAFALGETQLTFKLLHIGNRQNMPRVNVPAQPGWIWEEIVRDGDVVEQILTAASECSADLLVMSSQGQQGFLDTLLGSTTQQVLGQAKCPVFAIPTDQP